MTAIYRRADYYLCQTPKLKHSLKAWWYAAKCVASKCCEMHAYVFFFLFTATHNLCVVFYSYRGNKSFIVIIFIISVMVAVVFVVFTAISWWEPLNFSQPFVVVIVFDFSYMKLHWQTNGRTDDISHGVALPHHAYTYSTYLDTCTDIYFYVCTCMCVLSEKCSSKML